jgi:hypothetical protein
MTVIRHDNYDDEGPRGNQHVVGDHLTKDEAETLAKKMCDDPRRSEYDWFEVVSDDHVLYEFVP